MRRLECILDRNGSLEELGRGSSYLSFDSGQAKHGWSVAGQQPRRPRLPAPNFSRFTPNFDHSIFLKHMHRLSSNPISATLVGAGHRSYNTLTPGGASLEESDAFYLTQTQIPKIR
jgi:hypothetical protein